MNLANHGCGSAIIGMWKRYLQFAILANNALGTELQLVDLWICFPYPSQQVQVHYKCFTYVTGTSSAT